LEYFFHTDGLPELSKNQAWQKQGKYKLQKCPYNNNPHPKEHQ
jgi:hypothetical protein